MKTHLWKWTVCSVSLFFCLSCSDSASEEVNDIKDTDTVETSEQTSEQTSGNSVALFDSFAYTGNDEYFSENPLSDDSYYTVILQGSYPDPSICTNGNGDYYLVNSSFGYFPGIPIFHSQDLVNWEQIGNVLNRDSQMADMEGLGVCTDGIFASSIAYNPDNETYYVITTSVSGQGNFFVKAKDPAGPWSERISLPHISGIDPSLFFDDDGKAYIVVNSDPDGESEYGGHKAIRLYEFDVDTETTSENGIVLVNKGFRPETNPIWIEGPHLYKIDGKYFLMAAQGGSGEGHSEVIFSCDEVDGEYVAYSKNPILSQYGLDDTRQDMITSTGHADIIQIEDGSWWAVFLGNRPIDGIENRYENLGRETFLMPMKWDTEEGFPYITREYEDMISMIQSKSGVVWVKDGMSGNFERLTDFSDNNLGYEWLTLRSSASDLYSLSDNPGYLTLKCSSEKVSEKKVPAYVCRRIQHHYFEASTTMVLDAADENDMAGMLLFKNETHHYFFAVSQTDNDTQTIQLQKTTADGTVTYAKQNIKNRENPLTLKIISYGTYYDFYYAVDDGDWQTLCRNLSAGPLSDSSEKGGEYGYMGAMVGLYAVRNE